MRPRGLDSTFGRALSTAIVRFPAGVSSVIGSDGEVLPAAAVDERVEEAPDERTQRAGHHAFTRSAGPLETPPEASAKPSPPRVG